MTTLIVSPMSNMNLSILYSYCLGRVKKEDKEQVMIEDRPDATIEELRAEIRQLREENRQLREENRQLREQLNLPLSTIQGKECPICLGKLEPGWLARTPCWHIYHINCACQFMRYRLECPVCRQQLTTCSKIRVRTEQ